MYLILYWLMIVQIMCRAVGEFWPRNQSDSHGGMPETVDDTLWRGWCVSLQTRTVCSVVHSLQCWQWWRSLYISSAQRHFNVWTARL